MDLIQQGIAKGLIALSEDGKTITYLQQNKKYRYADPEEQIRAENYCSLVINYGYPAKRIDFEIRVPRRTPKKQTEIADHISALRTQAKQLQQQAAAELAQAKQHVEQLILGSPNS